MRHSHIMLVAGTRPEAIKLAPLFDALLARSTRVTFALTGQHSALDPAAYGFVGADLLRLRCPAGKDPQHHADLVAAALQRALRGSARPDLLVVQGDTSARSAGRSASRWPTFPSPMSKPACAATTLPCPGPRRATGSPSTR